MAGTSGGLEFYRLNGVQLTEKELGRGSYAVVLRLEYRGLKCAGKQLYPVLEQGVEDTVRRFEEECRLLAQIQHPNIVQFIGVYFEEGSRVPILVMEFLPTTLARCIDTYGVLPEEVSYSILHDVALGLYHLHSHTPPIVHRNLSANKVLLASNMTAKISDVGVARILNLTPQQMSRMTCTPGTPAYMPPEAMRANPRYDARIDQFSYGILMIHVLSGRWPLPVCEAARPDPRNPDQLIPVSEADRREYYLQDISTAHPLMDLILRCISNDPLRRARAEEMVQQIGDIVHQFPPSFADRVEALQRIETETNEKQALKSESHRLAAEAKQVRTSVTAELNARNAALQAQLRGKISRRTPLAQHHQEETKRSELAHSLEIEQTRLQLACSEVLQKELKSQNETFQEKLRSRNELHQVELMTEMEAKEQERSALRSELETLEIEIAGARKANQNLQATVAARDKEILSKDREMLSKRAELSATKEETAKVTSEQERLQAVVFSKDREIELKQREVHVHKREVSAKNKLIAAMRTEISAKEATLAVRDATITQKESVLKQQSSIIQGLNEQLTRARDFLAGQAPQHHPLHLHPLNPRAKIIWQPCSHLPVKMSSAQTVVIRHRVYCGGGDTFDDDDDDDNNEYRVFCYSPPEDTWNTLPACPVKCFGLGQLRGNLVTVGGRKKPDTVTNDVYEFDEVTQSWKQSIPPMPTVRSSPAVLSRHCTLIVAGGIIYSTQTSVVEVFREETSQWHTTDPFPFHWCDAWTSLLINNRWYLLGGRAEDQVVCANVGLLLKNALPHDQAFTDRDSTNSSAWEVTLPNTPHCAPAVAAFDVSLLAVGGATTNTPRNPQASVHVYSPCNHAWIHISNLPAPQMFAATAMLSPKELLVIGGWNTNGSQNTVYKGFLQIE